MPCCAATMLMNTQLTKSRASLQLQSMLRSLMLNALQWLRRLHVRLWTLSNTMRIQATTECNSDCHRIAMAMIVMAVALEN